MCDAAVVCAIFMGEELSKNGLRAALVGFRYGTDDATGGGSSKCCERRETRIERPPFSRNVGCEIAAAVCVRREADLVG